MSEQAEYSGGLVVDLDRCTGCQACVVACQAENNIPINDEQTFLDRRANAWIRIERYWEGEFPNVKARFLPVLCQHCENAPCEPVCPVYATHRSDDGLNVQVYNRCVGTRYCGNNCPYNVRFFNWEAPDWPEPLNAQLNPDVTVRSQGIVEKCTFCIQRISQGRIEAEKEGRKVRDGEVRTACQATCPTESIVFGDLNDPASAVHKLHAQKSRYDLLADLNTRPRTVYLAAVRNPNPALEDKA